MAKAKKPDQVDASVAELQAIKRLLMMFMIRVGLSQDDVAKVVGMDRSSVSRTLKGTGRKTITFRTQSDDEED